MSKNILTPEEYVAQATPDKQEGLSQLRLVFQQNLPAGFEEIINYGMIGYVVPKALYPKGYHCNTALPLPFIGLGATKGHISVHHMGMLEESALCSWFKEAYPQHSKTKLDMGKACIRFKKPQEIPLALMAELAQKMTPAQWINYYETTILKA